MLAVSYKRPVFEFRKNGQPTLGPLTDDQGSRTRGLLIQIFYNLYAKPVRNLKVLS